MNGARAANGEISKSKVFFPNLDGLRFIAFFLVFLQHGFGLAVERLNHQGLFVSTLHQGVFESGWIGVSFFFVLSGFLITYLILSEIRLKGRLDVLAFYMRRILRIWPLYYLVIIIGFLLYPLMKSVFGFSAYIETGHPIYYLVFLSNFDVIRLGHGHGAMSTNITWSVAIEEQFYFVWPLLFFFVQPRFYKYIFPIIIVGSALFRLAYINDGMVLYFHSLAVISDMAVGALGAYLSLNSAKFVEFFARLRAPIIALVYGIGGSLILFRESLFAAPVPGMLQRVIFTLFFAFIILEQNYSKSSLVKMETFTRISALGKYTYGLYLLHPIALLICANSVKLIDINVSLTSLEILQGLIGFALSLLLSYASFHLYEKRFLNLKQRFTYIGSTKGSDRMVQDDAQPLTHPA